MKNSLFARDNLTIHDFFTPDVGKKSKMEKCVRNHSLHQAQDDSDTPPTSASTTSVIETPPTPRESGGISKSTPPSPATEQRTDCERSAQHVPSFTYSSYKSNQRKTTSQSRKRKYEQLYLDFGQSSFGARTVCPICNTLFVHGVQEDETNHRKICDDYLHGVSLHGVKPYRMYPAAGLFQGHSVSSGKTTNVKTANVVEVKPNDTNQMLIRKVLSVKNIVDTEMGFVSSRNILENNVAFLYVLDKRIIGFCLVEKILRAFQVLSLVEEGTVVTNDSDDDQNRSMKENNNSCIKNDTKASYPVDASRFVRSLNPTKALMGVHQIWCHKNFRRQGIAKVLLDVAREKLIFGLVIPRELVAFSSPTMDGFQLACNYSDTQYPLVY